MMALKIDYNGYACGEVSGLNELVLHLQCTGYCKITCYLLKTTVQGKISYCVYKYQTSYILFHKGSIH